MKVFVLKRTEWEDVEFIGVFSTHEKAKYHQENILTYSGSTSIEEYEIDGEIDKERFYDVFLSLFDGSLQFFTENESAKEESIEKSERYNEGKTLEIVVKAKTKHEALLRARKKRTAWIIFNEDLTLKEINP